MSEELKPCPFCGRSDTICFSNNHEECNDDIDVPTMYIVVCSMHDGGCGGHSGYYETKLEAAAAWNRRAERTCHVVRSGEPSPTGVPRERRCSECGGMLTRFGAYCHNCGARVVSE